ncbi:hypothetical protein AALO_G00140000 [Alosa alosa]|uniref:Integrase core domain-containing protein n=1 Tax=Alosa alosa TaxID=278164 RepID=A0AAV6GMM8_9TELE|nr:hypothetical protein AALO_G00140000 [Alosa alosa]
MVTSNGPNRNSHISGKSVHNQRCCMPHIQSHLHQFQKAWNNNPLRMERNKSPLQLWPVVKAESTGANHRDL